MWRNRFSLLVFLGGTSLLLFLLHAISFISLFPQFLLQHFEQKADIAIFIQRDAPEYRVDAFREYLSQKKNSGKISDYWELSQEEALADFRKRYPEETRFLDQYNIENPFSTLFSIVPISPTDTTPLLESWLSSDEWRDVIDHDALKKSEHARYQVQNFLQFTSLSDKTFLFLRIFFSLLLFALFFLFVLLHIRGSRQEIQIMRLVGAKISFLQTPFLLQAFLLSLFSSLLGTLIFLWALDGVYVFLLQLSHELGIEGDGAISEFFQKEHIVSGTLFLNIFLLLVMSFFSAWLAVQRMLREQLFTRYTPS
ncbi:FtsX-like permease family protein [Candidatus Peregrinibacteria bacterium]|nr:MAG: FtsX-like permease family protein [Candidatus Peregrinibacteria bacterium]